MKERGRAKRGSQFDLGLFFSLFFWCVYVEYMELYRLDSIISVLDGLKGRTTKLDASSIDSDRCKCNGQSIVRLN